MSAISSASMQILWNRIPSQKFKPNRGIRQGCPLSPYLFVLCMEWLGLHIHAEIDNGKWDPIRLSRNGPAISRLFFADDLSMMIPKGVYDEIERIAREFIWGSASGYPKMSLVGWDSICQPRARGGLGLRHLSDQNSSFLMKIGFNLVSKSNVLWVRVLRSKYGWKEKLPDSIERSQCSHLWRSLSRIWTLLRENLVWSIGDRTSVRCWNDP
ncbi:hypothetical protein J1N35_011763 [Gossypium stocksii]|uniref:Reverse transcriptase domain-containing protein n=1 Tax=Gossypium stocksii TaxID=47602 RepID=A0A9D3W547_9ROSI|nr:hypothetical protein J1N35_011763 [Gossypium stocksii]